MGGIASAIIIPPSGSGFDRIVPGSQGEESFRRISVVQRIAPLDEEGRDRHARPRPDDAAISRERNNRQSRQLTVRSGPQSGARRLPDRNNLAVLHADTVALKSFDSAAFASTHFLAQMFGQAEGPSGAPFTYHRDGAALGSDAYRRAGAAPPRYSEQPTQFRIAI